MHCHHVVCLSVLRSLVGDNPGSKTNASSFRVLTVHSMSRRKTIPSLTHVEPHVSPSCPWCFCLLICSRFNSGCKRCPGHSWVNFTFSLFRSAAAPLRQGTPPPPSKCLPTRAPYMFEDTRICNRKDNPPLWSAKSGFFLMFISNYKLFSYGRFTLSVSAGQTYFFR